MNMRNIRQRMEAFSSRMAAEEVPGWELAEEGNPGGGKSSTWERKLAGLSSSIAWGGANQPAVVLQRFFRSVVSLRKIRESVRYHVSNPVSRRRLLVIQQLIDTEARYVQGLGLLSDGFQGMLRKERARLEQQPRLKQLGADHLSEERISSIFGNISQIEHIHQELYAALQERQEAQWLSMGVGDIFCDLLLPRVSLYIRYSSRFATALTALAKARHDPLFNRVLHTLQGKLGLGWPAVEDLLELPFERMRYYATALQELLLVSRLDVGSEEFYSLSQAACAMQDAELTMRGDREETDAMIRDKTLQRLLPGAGTAGGGLPGTKLVKEGWLRNHAEPEVRAEWVPACLVSLVLAPVFLPPCVSSMTTTLQPSCH